VAQIEYIHDEEISGCTDFVAVHFTREREILLPREQQLLALLTEHLPLQHHSDIQEVVQVGEHQTQAGSTGAPGDHDATSGEDAEEHHSLLPPLLSTLRRTLLHQDDEKPERPKSRILYSPSVLMSRWAPYRHLIVPTGPEGSILSSIFNLTICIIGPGMLALPLAFS